MERAFFSSERAPRRTRGGVLVNARERGAVLVEFALILPVFMMLVLGTFTGGTAYYRRSSIASASREGARYATLHPGSTLCDGTVPNCSWLYDVATVTEASAQGELGPSSTGRVICVGYLPTPGSAAYSLTWTTSDDVADAPTSLGAAPSSGTTMSVCGTTMTTSATDRQVVVVAQRSATLDALWTMNLTLKSASFGRAEANT